MVASRRAQILMEPAEYERLERLAKRSRVSVAELIRRAVRASYFARPVDSRSAARAICALDLPLGDWPDAEDEIMGAHGAHDAGLP